MLATEYRRAVPCTTRTGVTQSIIGLPADAAAAASTRRPHCLRLPTGPFRKLFQVEMYINKMADRVYSDRWWIAMSRQPVIVALLILSIFDVAVSLKNSASFDGTLHVSERLKRDLGSPSGVVMAVPNDVSGAVPMTRAAETGDLVRRRRQATAAVNDSRIQAVMKPVSFCADMIGMSRM